MNAVESIRQAAARLQIDYAHAVDTRDWALFTGLVSDDVVAEYDSMAVFHGLDEWLSRFVPFHDECVWTLHAMSNHRAEETADGAVATCYGDVRWIHRDDPTVLKHTLCLYRDDLVTVGGEWRIGRRRLHVLALETTDIAAGGIAFSASVLDVLDGSENSG